MPSSLQADLTTFILRELAALRREIEAYPGEDLIWSLPSGAPNSAGTLALHLAGNLQHYVGALLGDTGYVRDREAEFASRDVSRRDLLRQIDAAERAVRSVLPSLPEDALEDPFPEPMRGVTVSTRQALLQVATHLAYHLGQVDYHRRLLTEDGKGVDAMSPVAIVGGEQG